MAGDVCPHGWPNPAACCECQDDNDTSPPVIRWHVDGPAEAIKVQLRYDGVDVPCWGAGAFGTALDICDVDAGRYHIRACRHLGEWQPWTEWEPLTVTDDIPPRHGGPPRPRGNDGLLHAIGVETLGPYGEAVEVSCSCGSMPPAVTHETAAWFPFDRHLKAVGIDPRVKVTWSTW